MVCSILQFRQYHHDWSLFQTQISPGIRKHETRQYEWSGTDSLLQGFAHKPLTSSPHHAKSLIGIKFLSREKQSPFITFKFQNSWHKTEFKDH